MTLRCWVCCVIFFPALAATAQVPPFPNIDRSAPFGPGARTLNATASLQPGETTSNIELTVFYSDKPDDVQSMKSTCPQGTAIVSSVNGQNQAKLSFIFPHYDNEKPNKNDKNPTIYPSGRKLAFRIVKKYRKTAIASDIVEFRMPDKLTVASFGDSYASGEGSPYRAEKKWDNVLCHRSGNSGQAKAVREVKQAFPGLAIAFKNVACSGAAIADGVVKSQRKANFFQDRTLDAERVPPQFEQVERWLESNNYEQLNLALFSVGGNDVYFGWYVENFLIKPFNFNDDASAKQNLATDIAELDSSYDELKHQLDLTFDYDAAIITGYPNLLVDKQGALCDGRKADYGSCWGPVELSGGPGLLSTSPQAEYSAIKRIFLEPLNAKIKAKAEAFDKWTFVSTATVGENHGLCNCESPYFNTLGAALLDQGDPYGVAHPNRLGHERIYAAALLPILKDRIKDITKRYAIERAKDIAEAQAKAKIARAKKRAAHPVFTSKISAAPSVTPIPAEKLTAAKQTAKQAPRPPDVPDHEEAEDGE